MQPENNSIFHKQTALCDFSTPCSQLNPPTGGEIQAELWVWLQCLAFKCLWTSRWRANQPESVDTVDAARHVLSVVYVCGFWVEDLKQKQWGKKLRIMLEHVSRRWAQSENYTMLMIIYTPSGKAHCFWSQKRSFCWKREPMALIFLYVTNQRYSRDVSYWFPHLWEQLSAFKTPLLWKSCAHLWQSLFCHGVEPLDDVVCVSEMEAGCLQERNTISELKKTQFQSFEKLLLHFGAANCKRKPYSAKRVSHENGSVSYSVW